MLLYYILIPFAWLLWHIGFRIRVEGRENLKKVQTRLYPGAHPCFRHRPGVHRHYPVGQADGGVRQKGAVRDQRLSDVVLPLLRRCVCARHQGRDGGHLPDGGGLQAGQDPAHLPGGHPRKGRQTSAPKSGLFVIAAEAGWTWCPAASCTTPRTGRCTCSARCG